jgi:thymidylate kinase
MFLAIEGLDGAGKTTVSRLLVERNGGNYFRSTPQELLGYSLAETFFEAHFLYYLLGNYLTGKQIQKINGLSVTDGYVLRTITSHEALGLNPTLAVLVSPLMKTMPKPDLSIFLDCKRGERIKRLKTREKINDKFEIISPVIEAKATASYARWNQTLGHKLSSLNTVGLEIPMVIEAIENEMRATATRNRVRKEIGLHFQSYKHIIPRGGEILDIGTGTGLAASFLKNMDPCLKITGLDVRKYADYPQDIPLKIYDGGRAPFMDKSFDVSLLFYTLHHAASPHHLLAASARLTRKNISLIEEFDLPTANVTIEAMNEESTLSALGLVECGGHNGFNQPKLEKIFADNQLLIRNHEQLLTESTRQVEKHLYVVSHE